MSSLKINDFDKKRSVKVVVDGQMNLSSPNTTWKTQKNKNF